PRPDRPQLAVPRGQGSAPPPPLVARAGLREDWRNRQREDVRNERRDLLDRRPVRLDTERVTRDRFEVDRGSGQPDLMARQRENNERLARERAQQQDRRQ